MSQRGVGGVEHTHTHTYIHTRNERFDSIKILCVIRTVNNTANAHNFTKSNILVCVLHNKVP